MILVTAHAKINFFLEITGRRPDGYHTLSTVFQTISLGDELTFQSAPELALSCSDPALPVDERNLVMKAAVRLREALRESRGARIHLEKKIPMGAGLGGGSSDAAAVLKNLPALWGRRIGVSALRKLAVSLGADVPFFLKGGLCSAAGIGEQLRPMKPLPKTWLVLVYPGFGVSTKEAYAKVRLPFVYPHKEPSPAAFASLGLALSRARRGRGWSGRYGPPLPQFPIARWSRWSCAGREGEGTFFNRFEELVFPDHPELPGLKQDLLRAGAAAALMSGSGSAVFGVAGSREQGTQILAQIQKTYSQSWLVHTI